MSQLENDNVINNLFFRNIISHCLEQRLLNWRIIPLSFLVYQNTFSFKIILMLIILLITK